MPSFEIDGCWQGEYFYDANEAFPTLPAATRFTLMAKGEGFGRFQGTIQDDPGRGITESAVVRGQLQGLAITFTKRYPAFFMHYEGRTVALAEYLQVAFGMPLDYDPPVVPIEYEGEYDSAEESITGTWSCAPKQVKFSSGGQLNALEFPAVRGHWTARRTRN